jgi:hypothetical protein
MRLESSDGQRQASNKRENTKAYLVGLDTRWVLNHAGESGIGSGENVGRLGRAVTNVGVTTHLALVINAWNTLERIHSHENFSDVCLPKGGQQAEVNIVVAA